MPNAVDYLGWRGDLSFAAEPFGEVDALILSELSYMDLAGIVPEDPDEDISLSDAAERYFDLHGDETDGRKSVVRAAGLFREVKGTARFGSVRMFAYRSILSGEADVQMAAVSFRVEEGLMFTAFRGTDNTITGWKEDFMMSYLPVTEGQKLAARYLGQVYTGRRGKILVGGHSKGGNLAVYASAFCRKRIRQRIRTVYSFDGPGFRPEVLSTPEYAETAPKIVSILPEDSVVGMLLGTTGQARIVKTSEQGLAAHSMMTWQIYGKSFVEAEKRSGSSDYIDRTIDRWADSLSDEERERFVSTVFEFLENSGVQTVGQIREGGMSSVREIFRQARKLPREELTGLLSAAARLLRSGGEEAAARFRKEEDRT